MIIITICLDTLTNLQIQNAIGNHHSLNDGGHGDDDVHDDGRDAHGDHDDGRDVHGDDDRDGGHGDDRDDGHDVRGDHDDGHDDHDDHGDHDDDALPLIHLEGYFQMHIGQQRSKKLRIR
ncbi:hypothetical protein CDAR_460451 [Caerostris darwini]|uniref:Uncharacterized protein n=1 Tax=Caerostris darwini TaxID=1538125 RepID=A0AAV4PV42_9ARAC|nr:hypothetical protein CDAR_460451 [Caerostris darwini]